MHIEDQESNDHKPNPATKQPNQRTRMAVAAEQHHKKVRQKKVQRVSSLRRSAVSVAYNLLGETATDTSQNFYLATHRVNKGDHVIASDEPVKKIRFQTPQPDDGVDSPERNPYLLHPPMATP